MLKTGTRLDARYLPSPRPWKERVNTNGKSERTRDGRGASCSSHRERRSPCLFSSAHKMSGSFYLAFRLLHHPQQRCHVLLLTYNSSRVAMTSDIDMSFSHQQHSRRQQQQHLPHMHGAFVARTMQHPVSTMAQISVFDVATAGTVPPGYSE